MQLGRATNQPQFRVPLTKQQPRPDEESTYYWHPGRFGVRLAPESFRARLHEIHPKLEITWHPIKQRWMVWYQDPTIAHHLCPGWKLIFVVQTSWGDYVPLDERTFAVIHARSGFKSNGREYFDRIMREMERETEALRRRDQADVEAQVSERWDHTKIQVAMRGHSTGSKFSKHHSGD